MKIYPPFFVVGERKVADRRIDIIKKSGTYFLYSELDEDVILYDFLQAWDSSQDIKECLLPEVISVLSGDVEFTDIGADIFGVAYIKPQVTKLIGGMAPDLELSTMEFKELVEQWVAFLEFYGR
ncbi:hypothetical protein [Microbulbifer sp. THAF38]|uniref:hypothetical protein n=1 Tax=Microbulbifer sp. THAF38 TaxID=2587856 RepID=UPI00126899E3|nr:hypothetical protein [Microbulbifer sp. THAF38]QFT55707.1 hypothetical protein FIU95_14250 [Microbulbifer sp. THAF38]